MICKLRVSFLWQKNATNTYRSLICLCEVHSLDDVLCSGTSGVRCVFLSKVTSGVASRTTDPWLQGFSRLEDGAFTRQKLANSRWQRHTADLIWQASYVWSCLFGA